LSDVVEYDCVHIDRARHQVSVEGRIIELTPTEFRLLEYFIRQPGRVFSRKDLLSVAVDGSVVLERTTDVHVKELRRKLGHPELIETVRSFGYRFREKHGT
jgi:two-component system, OmpR family, phosphate regulon response regulator PhoB